VARCKYLTTQQVSRSTYVLEVSASLLLFSESQSETGYERLVTVETEVRTNDVPLVLNIV
jgi:hypothetical protein